MKKLPPGIFQPPYVNSTGERKASQILWIRYHYRGRLYRESSGSTKVADARRLRNRRLAEMGQGRLVGPDVEKTTFQDLVAMLVNDYQANGRRSLKRIKQALAHLGSYFGAERRALDITVDQSTAYIAHRQAEGASAGTINRELAALKRAFSLAEIAGKVLRRPRFAMLAEHNARTGFFERAEFEAVLQHLPEYLRPLMSVAFITGWRAPSELCTRQRRHLDLEHGWLRLEPGQTKNEEGRQFPLIPELREILEEQLERTRAFEAATGQIVPWLFHNAGRPILNYYAAWRTACRLAGISRVAHDFRRTAVRNLERAGVSRSAAMKMTGHKTEAVYRRYAIVDSGMLQEAGAKLTALHDADKLNVGSPTVVPLHRKAKSK